MNEIMTYSLYGSMGNMFLDALAGTFEIMLLITKIVLMIKVVFLILGIVARWVIFEKAGEGGWKSLIPVYSVYTKYKISNIPKIFFVEIAILMFQLAFSILEFDIIAGVLGIIASVLEGIVLQINLAKVFNKGLGFKLGLIFFPEIFEMILAFGDSNYMIQENEYDFHDIERH